MSNQKSKAATIVAEPGSQQITITRDFAASPAKVWRAFTEPELMARWIGPDRLTTTIETNEVRDGGHVSFEWVRIEDLGDGRSRVHANSVFMSVEDRDGMIQSGMDVGVNEGYARLDAILAPRS
jgi:uncharacterized protein YndB with AHSA1/START domain